MNKDDNLDVATMAPFNQEELYENEIRPLITKLFELATVHNFPMFITICTKAELGKGEFLHTSVVNNIPERFSEMVADMMQIVTEITDKSNSAVMDGNGTVH